MGFLRDSPKTSIITISDHEELWFYRCWIGSSRYFGRMHRLAPWIGDDDIARHLCGNNRCINPLHLTGGTSADNGRDKTEHLKLWHNTVDIFSKEDIQWMDYEGNIVGGIVGYRLKKKFEEGSCNKAEMKVLIYAAKFYKSLDTNYNVYLRRGI